MSDAENTSDQTNAAAERRFEKAFRLMDSEQEGEAQAAFKAARNNLRKLGLNFATLLDMMASSGGSAEDMDAIEQKIAEYQQANDQLKAAEEILLEENERLNQLLRHFREKSTAPKNLDVKSLRYVLQEFRDEATILLTTLSAFQPAADLDDAEKKYNNAIVQAMQVRSDIKPKGVFAKMLMEALYMMGYPISAEDVEKNKNLVQAQKTIIREQSDLIERQKRLHSNFQQALDSIDLILGESAPLDIYNKLMLDLQQLQITSEDLKAEVRSHEHEKQRTDSLQQELDRLTEANARLSKELRESATPYDQTYVDARRNAFFHGLMTDLEKANTQIKQLKLELLDSQSRVGPLHLQEQALLEQLKAASALMEDNLEYQSVLIDQFQQDSQRDVKDMTFRAVPTALAASLGSMLFLSQTMSQTPASIVISSAISGLVAGAASTLLARHRAHRTVGVITYVQDILKSHTESVANTKGWIQEIATNIENKTTSFEHQTNAILQDIGIKQDAIKRDKAKNAENRAQLDEERQQHTAAVAAWHSETEARREQDVVLARTEAEHQIADRISTVNDFEASVLQKQHELDEAIAGHNQLSVAWEAAKNEWIESTSAGIRAQIEQEYESQAQLINVGMAQLQSARGELAREAQELCQGIVAYRDEILSPSEQGRKVKVEIPVDNLHAVHAVTLMHNFSEATAEAGNSGVSIRLDLDIGIFADRPYEILYKAFNHFAQQRKQTFRAAGELMNKSFEGTVVIEGAQQALHDFMTQKLDGVLKHHYQDVPGGYIPWVSLHKAHVNGERAYLPSAGRLSNLKIDADLVGRYLLDAINKLPPGLQDSEIKKRLGHLAV